MSRGKLRPDRVKIFVLGLPHTKTPNPESFKTLELEESRQSVNDHLSELDMELLEDLVAGQASGVSKR